MQRIMLCFCPNQACMAEHGTPAAIDRIKVSFKQILANIWQVFFISLGLTAIITTLGAVSHWSK